MKGYLKCLLAVVLGLPLMLVLFLMLRNGLRPNSKDIQSKIERHAADKVDFILWLQATEQSYSESPVFNASMLAPVNHADATGDATTVIASTYIIRGDWDCLFATPKIQVSLYYAKDGRLVRSNYDSFYIGF